MDVRMPCVPTGGKNVRNDFAHKSSFFLVKSDAEVLVFEALKLKNMTAAPEAKVDPNNGRYIRNGAAAKVVLNKSMLECPRAPKAVRHLQSGSC
jgi:hypothetical protein